MSLGLNIEVDAARRKGDFLTVLRVEGFGAELSGAEISGVGHFVLVDQVLEERKDVEIGE